jgi:hypothetical protein
LGWVLLGGVFGFAARRRGVALNRARQEELILGDYAPLVRRHTTEE